ncbi:chaplin [Streptomyces johnsoniae]|uniref:Chaplin n=1 Tax=Streptomyces johnsoniae TaxID=3075532 RepID=A0ABU2S1S0_9ACTN|nr:chaplin [Streptomyces sp. DSM 41886]MDT0442946.1 chaplin [Streptomyces sp. DSM 41886]
MRQVTKKGLITVAAAGGLLGLASGSAQAESNAGGAAANSPGVASGNTIQAPVNAPVTLCGNTVNVVGVLNPAFGNNCVVGGGSGGGPGGPGGGGGAEASGTAAGSPGVASGNNIQAPVNAPVTACGNSVSVVGVLNPVFGNGCAVDAEAPAPPAPPAPPVSPEAPEEPTDPAPPAEPVDEEPAPLPADPAPEAVPVSDAQDPAGELAATGGGLPVAGVLPLGAGLLFGGVVLYRRGRLARQG